MFEMLYLVISLLDLSEHITHEYASCAVHRNPKTYVRSTSSKSDLEKLYSKCLRFVQNCSVSLGFPCMIAAQ